MISAMAKTQTTKKTKSNGFTAEERAAMRERSRELKRSKKGADAEDEVLAKIAEMDAADRTLAERLHALIRAVAPDLAPRTWYGMPAYAKDGKVLCYFQNAAKFKSRYSTFGFNDAAALDDGEMWPTSFALTQWTDGVEARIGALVEQAVS
jgi:uncharacterized protein YdhG (YjbR/CyaY superfamily)